MLSVQSATSHFMFYSSWERGCRICLSIFWDRGERQFLQDLKWLHKNLMDYWIFQWKCIALFKTPFQNLTRSILQHATPHTKQASQGSSSTINTTMLLRALSVHLHAVVCKNEPRAGPSASSQEQIKQNIAHFGIWNQVYSSGSIKMQAEMHFYSPIIFSSSYILACFSFVLLLTVSKISDYLRHQEKCSRRLILAPWGQFAFYSMVYVTCLEQASGDLTFLCD